MKRLHQSSVLPLQILKFFQNVLFLDILKVLLANVKNR